MMKKASSKIVLAMLLFACALVTGAASAGYMDFTVESLRVEDTGGC